MLASASVSEILDRTDFTRMGSTTPPPSTNGVAVNGAGHSNMFTFNSHSSPSPSKPVILHLGAPITYNPDIYDRLDAQFEIIRPDPSDLERQPFIQHLKNKTWGKFSAIMKPFWSTGKEMHPWDQELINWLPDSMKIMAGAGAGFDWVDTNALAARGILYCNGAHASTESVTNTALYHLISVFTHATYSSLAARSLSPKAFEEAHVSIPLISHNPFGHTLGIVGLGNIGLSIARKVNAALGMKILYNDVIRKSSIQEREAQATYFPTLESMLPHCDCLILATPSGPPLITRSTLSLLPRGARIVNIARGSLVDEAALADALDEGHISAAGLDVHALEPKVYERFANMRNVQLTCHTAGASVETNRGFERLAMENVEEVLLGRGAVTAVNAAEVELYRAGRAGVVNGVNGVHGVHDSSLDAGVTSAGSAISPSNNLVGD